MTSGCSGRWHRCCSCQAPLHTRPHLEEGGKREGVVSWWSWNVLDDGVIRVMVLYHKIQNIKLHVLYLIRQSKRRDTKTHKNAIFENMCSEIMNTSIFFVITNTFPLFDCAAVTFNWSTGHLSLIKGSWSFEKNTPKKSLNGKWKKKLWKQLSPGAPMVG